MIKRKYILIVLLALLLFGGISNCANFDKSFRIVLTINRTVLDTTENLVLDAYSKNIITWDQLIKFHKIDKQAIILYNMAVQTRNNVAFQKYYLILKDMITVLEEIGVDVPDELKIIAQIVIIGKGEK